MGGINFGRVVLGGLLAGLVIDVSESILNGVVLAGDMDAAMRQRNLPAIGGGAIAVFLVLGFALGIATIWLYAAIRPRFGAGVKTALCAGSAVWFFAYLYPSIGMVVLGFFSVQLITIATLWGLVELLVAGAAGAWLYTEAPSGSKEGQRGASHVETRSVATPSSDQEPIASRLRSSWILASLLSSKVKLSASEDLTLCGQMEGSIKLPAHTLTVGSGADIKAEISAKIVVIMGAVTGNVTAGVQVGDSDHGSVTGDIVSPRLVIADGGRLHGTVQMPSERGRAPKS